MTISPISKLEHDKICENFDPSDRNDICRIRSGVEDGPLTGRTNEAANKFCVLLLSVFPNAFSVSSLQGRLPTEFEMKKLRASVSTPASSIDQLRQVWISVGANQQMILKADGSLVKPSGQEWNNTTFHCAFVY